MRRGGKTSNHHIRGFLRVPPLKRECAKTAIRRSFQPVSVAGQPCGHPKDTPNTPPPLCLPPSSSGFILLSSSSSASLCAPLRSCLPHLSRRMRCTHRPYASTAAMSSRFDFAGPAPNAVCIRHCQYGPRKRKRVITASRASSYTPPNVSRSRRMSLTGYIPSGQERRGARSHAEGKTHRRIQAWPMRLKRRDPSPSPRSLSVPSVFLRVHFFFLPPPPRPLCAPLRSCPLPTSVPPAISRAGPSAAPPGRRASPVSRPACGSR